uniref:Photosystem I reaction center subunit XI n=1 Tax=Cyanothece sp. (strain PCC 7425 / ATCC 29141) TaxID=395961 RepID=B8HLT6_CYAP4
MENRLVPRTEGEDKSGFYDRQLYQQYHNGENPMQTVDRNPASPSERFKDHPGDPRDRRNQEVIHTAGSIDNSDLATPINSSALIKAYINNLPAYRKGLTAFRRGLEVGMAHGYWLIGPFAKLGPLRDTDMANLAGLFSTVGLLIISTLAISLYANSNPPPQPVTNVTTDRNVPDAFTSPEGWNEYAGGFLIGGIGGAGLAYFLLANIEAFSHLINR